MDPLNWIQTHIPPWLFITLIVHVVVLGAVAYLILLERKVASWVQDRIGPNRVGLGFGIIPGLKDFHFWGLGQPLADGLKFIMKEDYRPKHADFILFTLAPAIMVIVIIISIATVPWAGPSNRPPMSKWPVPCMCKMTRLLPRRSATRIRRNISRRSPRRESHCRSAMKSFPFRSMR